LQHDVVLWLGCSQSGRDVLQCEIVQVLSLVKQKWLWLAMG
jgi:hypothetical protein